MGERTGRQCARRHSRIAQGHTVAMPVAGSSCTNSPQGKCACDPAQHFISYPGNCGDDPGNGDCKVPFSVNPDVPYETAHLRTALNRAPSPKSVRCPSASATGQAEPVRVPITDGAALAPGALWNPFGGFERFPATRAPVALRPKHVGLLSRAARNGRVSATLRGLAFRKYLSLEFSIDQKKRVVIPK